MVNPYHDGNGKFSSKDEVKMNEVLTETIKSGDYSAAWDLKDAQTVKKTKTISAQDKFIADADVLTKRDMARNFSTDPEILRKLSKDKDNITKIGVASNVNAPSDLLKKLSTHKDWGVRLAVAKNVNTPVSVLETLSQDKDFWVKSEFEKNPRLKKIAQKRMFKSVSEQ